jgi:hypothetical protein
MNENNKRIIYNAESFTNIIAEINNHIANINNCFNDEFTLESYKGSQKENIELAINNILSTLKHFLDGLNNIPEDLLMVKQKYEEAINTGHIAVNGGDRNV